MKSRIEVRKFAIENAVAIMGVGSKDVVSKAKEIEEYIIGGAELPEVYNETDTLMSGLSSALGYLGTEPTSKKK